MSLLMDTLEIIKKKKASITYRRAKKDDIKKIKELYKATAAQPGGISRKPHEITDEYINNIVLNSLKRGLMIVAEENRQIIGSIHAYKFEQESLSHLLSNLTFLIHPAHQGKGVGKALFSYFMEYVKESMPEIIRVELFVRKSNEKAVKLYESCGFEVEGYLKRRIKTTDGIPETDSIMAWVR